MATQKVFLGNALITDHGDWAEGKTAQTNDIYHTADGAFMSTVDNNTTAPGVGVGGWRVWFDESKIKKAETDRDKRTNAAIGSVNALLAAFASTNPFCGFARVYGDADPSPAETNVFGSKELIRQIGRHIKLGTVKRVDGEAVLQHECAPGRITKASNGDVVAVDGTEGDILVYSDATLYLTKANATVDGAAMSCLGVGMVPTVWQNHASKPIGPFAFAPFYGVVTKLEGDERSCTHCIISDSVNGTYAAANGFVKETYKASGAGYPSNGATSLTSIYNAQNKNADAATNYPYMGGYYEFYELLIAMMYAECGTLNTTDLYCMGTGCTQMDTVGESTWNSAGIAANSGIKMFAADGSVAGYAGLMSKSLKNGASGETKYNLEAVVGSQYYVLTKCGESLQVLDAISKAGLQSRIGSNTSIFYMDAGGNMACSADGSINIDTGEGMTPNTRYYIVRDVPGCEGIADGVMTAVINCYVKFSVSDGIYAGSTDLTGGHIIYKFSHSIYRGLAIPMDGMFMHLSGAHYLTGRTESGYYNRFYCADKWQDVAPLTSSTAYGNVGSAETFNILKGLNNVKTVPGTSDWVKGADYSLSLFCFDKFSGGSHTYECCYTWNGNYMWGYGSNGLPEVGKEGVKALVVGCYAVSANASARTAYCDNAVSFSYSSYAFALAVPKLKLS